VNQTRLYLLKPVETADPSLGGMFKHSGFVYKREGEDSNIR